MRATLLGSPVTPVVPAGGVWSAPCSTHAEPPGREPSPRRPCSRCSRCSFGAGHDEPVDRRIATDGRALAGVEIRIVDDDGNDLSPGEPGEIWSRGPDLCAGYTDPVLTAEAFDDEGWYSSGDIGTIDGGWLTITDRKKDIIIRGGETISPLEVEDVLMRMPEVAEVAVVAAPDERLGERGCAFVRLADGTDVLALDDIRTHLAKVGLAKQKWPEELRIVDDFPRTPSAKIKKFELRDSL